MLIIVDGVESDYPNATIPQYTTKSQIFSFEFCPIQYFKQYILKEPQEPTYEMVIGTRFHEYAETFFNNIDEIPYELWQETIPFNFSEYEKQMCLNFLCKEDLRYESTDYEMFKPYNVEMWCQSENLKLRGFIDRIDWKNKDENELMLVEYKTGSSFKDVQLRQELALYSLLFNDVTENQFTITHTACFNPKLNKYEEWELKQRDINNVMRKWNRLNDALNDMTFVSKCDDFKQINCGRCKNYD